MLSLFTTVCVGDISDLIIECLTNNYKTKSYRTDIRVCVVKLFKETVVY